MLQINKNDFKKIQTLIDKGVTRAFSDAGNFFKKKTPRDKGYAQNNTHTYNTKNRKIIEANYDYASVLDEGLFPKQPKKGTGKTINGYSTQAPKGMTKPTMDAYPDLLENRLRNLGLL